MLRLSRIDSTFEAARVVLVYGLDCPCNKWMTRHHTFGLIFFNITDKNNTCLCSIRDVG